MNRSHYDIEGGVKLNVEQELSNAADRYSKEKNHDTNSNSNADDNYYFEGKTSTEKVHNFAGRLKTDNVTKKDTAKHIRSIHRNENKDDQKVQDLTPTKRSLKWRHVVSGNFMNSKLNKEKLLN